MTNGSGTSRFNCPSFNNMVKYSLVQAGYYTKGKGDYGQQCIQRYRY